MTEIKNSPGDIVIMENSLRMNSAFSPWSREAMNRLLSSSKIGRHTAGFVFSGDLREAAESFFVISGEVMVTLISREGAQFNVMIMGPGVLMGIAQIFNGTSQIVLAFRAHSDVMVIHMPTSLVVEILDREPVLWKAMVLMMTRQSAAQVHTVSSQIAGPLRQRVAAAIERLAALYGTRVRGGLSIRLQISQAILATMLQANRQAVHRELKAIAASGVISLQYKAIEIRDLDALKNKAIQAQCGAPSNGLLSHEMNQKSVPQ